MSGFQKYLFTCFLLLCASAIVHCDSGSAPSCAPRLDQFSVKFSMEEVSDGTATIRHTSLGEITLDRNTIVDVENMSLAITHVSIDGTCGGFVTSQRCEAFSSGKASPHLLVRKITGNDISYLELTPNISIGAQNKFRFDGRDFVLAPVDAAILGSCISKDAYYCPDGVEMNGCLPKKPEVCGSENPYAQVCGCLQFYSQDGNECYLPKCAEGAAKDRTCQFNGEVEDSKIVNTLCIRGEWVKYQVVEDCSAEGLTCMVQNRLAQCVNFTCEDGTKFGSCSKEKPKFCGPNGIFGNDVAKCGCKNGSLPDAAKINCIPFACEDGTLLGTCSATAPLFCSPDGELLRGLELCGQPDENASGTITAPDAAPPTDTGKNGTAANGQQAAPKDDGILLYSSVAVLLAAIAAAYYFSTRPKAA